MTRLKNGWALSAKNQERADHGRAALAAAGTDFSPDADEDNLENMECLVCDAICNICHYLGSQCWSDAEIRKAIVRRGINLHYRDEKDGTAD